MLSSTAEVLHLKKNINTVYVSEYHFSLEAVLWNRTEAIEIWIVQVNYTNTNPFIKENWNYRLQQNFKECFNKTDDFEGHYRKKRNKKYLYDK